MKSPILTDAEIEARVRMKYKRSAVHISAINQEVADLKEIRDQKYRLKFNDIPLTTEK